MSVSAVVQDLVLITGLARVHQGKEETFYTVIAQDRWMNRKEKSQFIILG